MCRRWGSRRTWQPTSARSPQSPEPDVRDIRANDVETPITAGKVTSIQNTTARQRFAGGFGELLYTHGGWSGAASVRVDYAANLDTVQKVNATATPLADRTEVVANPRLGLVRRVNRVVSLKAAGFRAFRAPTMNELYRTGQVGQQVTNANPNLLSERATGWEAGATLGSEADRLSGSATTFGRRSIARSLRCFSPPTST